MDKIPTLIVSPPDSEPITFELSGARVGLGREVDNQIQVDVGAVSSCHCEFRKTADGIEIVDLKSTNGTRVNGKKIESHALVDGDRLLLGETVGAHYVELAEGESVKPAAIAGGEEENKAAAAYTKMDEKLQSITADIVAKEAEHQEIAASLAKMREEFEAKKKERDTLLASMKSLEEQIAAKRAASGAGDSDAANQEVVSLEKELMLQTRRVQVLASDIDGQRQQMQQLEAAAPPPPTKPGSGPIKVAAMTPPSGGERTAPPAPAAQPASKAPPAGAPPAAAPAAPVRPAAMAPPQPVPAAPATPVPPPPAAPPAAPPAPPQNIPKAIPIPPEIAQPAPGAKTVMLP